MFKEKLKYTEESIKDVLYELFIIKHLSRQEISNRLRISRHKLNEWIDFFGYERKILQKNRSPINVNELIGKTFGEWTINDIIETKGSKSKVDCTCSCGRHRIVELNNILSERSTKCQNCHTRRYVGKLGGHDITQLRNNAKRRNIDFLVSQKYLWELFLSQNNTCGLSGIFIDFADTGKEKHHGGNTASLDRIDSLKGYTEDNVWWIHKHINQMKRDYTLKYFLKLCSYVSNFDLKFCYKEFELPKFPSYFKGIGLIHGIQICSIKKGAQARKIDYNLEKEYIWELYKRQGGICALSGMDIGFEPNRKNRNLRTASLDRIDNSIGYIENNVMWTHKHINLMRNTFSVEYFREMCKNVDNYQNIKKS